MVVQVGSWQILTIKSWSNWKPNDSLWICSCRYWNTSYLFNLIMFWLRYLRLKTTDTISIKISLHVYVHLWKLRLVFDLEYHCQFFIHFQNEWQFHNPQDKQISKLSLVFGVIPKDEAVMEQPQRKTDSRTFCFVGDILLSQLTVIPGVNAG